MDTREHILDPETSLLRPDVRSNHLLLNRQTDMTTSKYADYQFKYGRTRDSHNENRIATALDNAVAHIVSMGSVMYPHVVQDWESSNGAGGNLSFEELFCTPSSQTALEFAWAENARA